MKEFRFIQAENGGWVVVETEAGPVSLPIRAAFTSTDDMLAGFTDLLEPVTDPELGEGGLELEEGDV